MHFHWMPVLRHLANVTSGEGQTPTFLPPSIATCSGRKELDGGQIWHRQRLSCNTVNFIQRMYSALSLQGCHREGFRPGEEGVVEFPRRLRVCEGCSTFTLRGAFINVLSKEKG